MSTTDESQSGHSNNEGDFAYCTGPHRFLKEENSKATRAVVGPFRVRVRILNGKIGSRCPICGRMPYLTKEEVRADLARGIRV